MDDPIKAAEIANASGDKAACYHLARQYENIDNIPEAIHFFSKAQAYSNAIRICKEQGKNKPIIGLVLTRVGFGILASKKSWSSKITSEIQDIRPIYGIITNPKYHWLMPIELNLAILSPTKRNITVQVPKGAATFFILVSIDNSMTLIVGLNGRLKAIWPFDHFLKLNILA